MPASLLEAMIADLLYPAAPRSGQMNNERRAPLAGSSVSLAGRLHGGSSFSLDAGGGYAAVKIERRPSEACAKLHVQQQLQQQLLHQQQQQLLARDIVKAAQVGPASAAVTASRYKTEMCRPYEETGHCRYGFKCQFAHGAHELRNLNRHPKYKTELCRTFHSTGFCSYGQRCNFIHNDDERLPQGAPIEVRRPRALSIAMGSAGDSPASSVSGDSPSSSPGFLTDDVFGSGRARVPAHFFPSSPAPPVSPIGARRFNNAAAACGSAHSLFGGLEASLADSGFSDDFGSPPSPAASDADYPGCYNDGSTAFDLCGLHHSLFKQLTINGGGELN